MGFTLRKMMLAGLVVGLLGMAGTTAWAGHCSSLNCPYCSPSCDIYGCVNAFENVTCSGGYTCQRHYCAGCKMCGNGGNCKTRVCEAPEHSIPAAVDRVVATVLTVLADEAYANHAVGSDPELASYGYRNSMNLSGGGGTIRRCEAKLHVCYVGGHMDSAIPSTVNTLNACNNACDTMISPNQIACAYSDCQSRCYAARVYGYADSCS